jgi:hypothetical protein
MSKPSRKQIAITTDQLNRAMHYLGELNLDYALVIKGTPVIFTNVDKRYALSLLSDCLELQTKIHDEQVQAEAERLADVKINPDDGTVGA